VLVVDASTGGPRALAAALGELPAEFPLPIAVVQHMPPEMSEFLASGLSANCRMRVRLAEHGARVEAGVLWVAPGGAHLTIARDGARACFRLDHEPEENGCRPAVDPLFRSAARVYGATTLALVLTGMGQDGVAGARAVNAAGGRVLVQDEATSVVWGMPGAIARAGLADAVLPLSQMAGELIVRTRRKQPPRQAEAA
jgi:two-component system chemotaxis response regulator CheB